MISRNALYRGLLLGVMWAGTGQAEDACVHCSSYVASSALEKEQIIMDKIMATEYPRDNLRPWSGVCDSIAAVEAGLVDANNMFDRFSDERPQAFARFSHFSGINAAISFVSNDNHPFTGIFRGADHGVMRFSPIGPLMPERLLHEFFIGSVPYSFAAKFFRNGIHSTNIQTSENTKEFREFAAARQFYDSPDYNIFSRSLDNMPGIADDFDIIFGEFEKYSGVLSTADAASYDQFGTEESDPKSPIIVSFRPNPIFREKFGKASLEFRSWATTEEAIPSGTLLYGAWTTVFTESGEASLCVDAGGVPLVTEQDVNDNCPDQSLVHIGDLYTKSRFYASSWSDDKLFFQHTRMCPKDQSICSNSDPAGSGEMMNPDTLEMGNPDTTFAVDNFKFCRSSDDKSGQVLGIPPTCPFAATFQNENCYPGTQRGVEGIQQRNCPFMSSVAQDILTIEPGSNPEFPACDDGYNLQNSVLEAMFSVLAPVLRGTTDVCPFTKGLIDSAIGLLPFGPP